jgi:hypothetical protein
MNLKITKNDIKNGKQHDPANCAIARSMKRKCKNNKKQIADISILPGHASLSVYEGNKIVVYGAKMPIKGSQFVYDFDNGVSTKPLNLILPFKKVNSYKACAI